MLNDVLIYAQYFAAVFAYMALGMLASIHMLKHWPWFDRATDYSAGATWALWLLWLPLWLAWLLLRPLSRRPNESD